MTTSKSDGYATPAWDSYVIGHPLATAWHMSPWKDIFEESYGHKACYLLAGRPLEVRGVLPLFHFRSLIFGSSLVSMPFLDGGGLLADDEETGKELLRTASALGRKLGVSRIEMRFSQVPDWMGSIPDGMGTMEHLPGPVGLQHNKVRMCLPLPGSSEELLSSFKSKLRSQIKRPLREGCITAIGGIELLDRFYRVFSTNMRDLGSPVHSRKFFASLLSQLPENTRICIVDLRGKTIAAAVLVWFRDTICNPWASSDKRYSQYSPNMLLYWTMLQFACDQGFAFFDFGRSSVNEGTYRFKEQWGCRPQPLVWLTLYLNGSEQTYLAPDKKEFSVLVRLWKKLPLPVAEMAGPIIRRHISL